MRGVLLVLFVCTIASGETVPACLVAFANTAPTDEGGIELVASTYRELVEKVGGQLTPQTLRQMAASESPFEVPEQKGADLIGIRRRLRELNEMVEEKGWRFPATTERLARELTAMADRLERGSSDVDRAVREASLEVPIPLPHASGHAISPDGRYLVTWNKSKTGPDSTLYVYDHLDNRVREYLRPGDGVHLGIPFFMHGGGSLWFPMKNADLKRVKFRNGVPDWTHENVVGDGTGTFQLNKIRDAGDGENFYASLATEVYRINTKDNSRLPIHFDEYLKSGGTGSELRRFIAIPGSQSLSVLSFDGTKKVGRLETVNIDGKGNVTPVPGTRTEWDASNANRQTHPDPWDVTWSADGQHAYLWSGNVHGAVAVIDRPGGRPRWFREGSQGATGDSAHTVLAHPTTGDIFIVVEPKNFQYRVDIIDAKTQELKGQIPLPKHVHSYAFSPDGTLFYATGNDHTTALRWRTRVSP